MGIEIDKSLNKIIELYSKSIVLIESRISGNGFFISDEYIITNYHVVRNSDKIKGIFKDCSGKNFSIDLSIFDYNIDQDYAILNVVDFTAINKHNCVFLAETFPSPNNHYELMYSSLKYTRFKGKKGIIQKYDNSCKKIIQKESYYINDTFISIEVKEAVEKGSSGSPILDKISKKVCGVISLGDNKDKRHFAKVIPIEKIKLPRKVKKSIREYHNRTNLKWLSLLNIEEIEKQYHPLPPKNWLKNLSESWKKEFHHFTDPLGVNEIEETDRFERLFDFKKLTINTESISKLEPLRNFIHLKKLVITNTKITSIHPIENLVKLEKLDLSNNKKLIKIDPIEGFYKLQELDLSNTAITSITPIINNLNLQKLNLSNTIINNIQEVDQLVNLKTLVLKELDIDDFSFLYEFDNLKSLTCKCNEVQFKYLINKLKLEYISINSNFINSEEIKNIWEQYVAKYRPAQFYDYNFYE